MTVRRIAPAGMAVLAGIVLANGPEGPAQAQIAPLCGPQDRIVRDIIGTTFAEMPILEMSIRPNGELPVRIYANERTGTWTAVVLRPDGVACVVMAGYGIKPVIIPVGDPA